MIKCFINWAVRNSGKTEILQWEMFQFDMECIVAGKYSWPKSQARKSLMSPRRPGGPRKPLETRKEILDFDVELGWTTSTTPLATGIDGKWLTPEVKDRSARLEEEILSRAHGEDKS
ncbi:hypothetical protein INT45_000678 [Circinella minor]|uniref:Uncharacterized protein n=2 Tax=Mucorales TaxID=4827 RepID=A0A8H7QG98_9FUNG|nr:hypothetical protein INT47_010527 [Mucor saturninus]KAG2217706.1 hypothetical protein INT45_000678 [Circinella minor]